VCVCVCVSGCVCGGGGVGGSQIHSCHVAVRGT
jgi:hypothetical protein